MLIGSLFAGIGGLELGLEMSGVGRTLWQVEIDPKCRAVLERHWPATRRYFDIRQCADLPAVDLICGGFPCQDVSSAGKRAGLTGPSSGLWFQYLRVVSELRPQWVVVENVASGANAWVDTVLAGLAELSYACLPIPISAADVGAPHLRRRIFVLACHAHARRQSMGAVHEEMAGLRRATEVFPDWTKPPGLSLVDGYASDMAALGNAVVPQCSAVIGHIIRELVKE